MESSPPSPEPLYPDTHTHLCTFTCQPSTAPHCPLYAHRVRPRVWRGHACTGADRPHQGGGGGHPAHRAPGSASWGGGQHGGRHAPRAPRLWCAGGGGHRGNAGLACVLGSAGCWRGLRAVTGSLEHTLMPTRGWPCVLWVACCWVHMVAAVHVWAGCISFHCACSLLPLTRPLQLKSWIPGLVHEAARELCSTREALRPRWLAWLAWLHPQGQGSAS